MTKSGHRPASCDSISPSGLGGWFRPHRYHPPVHASEAPAPDGAGLGPFRRASPTGTPGTDSPRATGRRLVVHVGYHRTATTWLQTVAFAAHPEIASVLGDSSFGQVASDRFLGQVVFARDTDFDAEAARAHLDARVAVLGAERSEVLVVSAERLSGNAASGGFDAARIAERLRAAVPEARIVVVLRHQAEAIASEYKEIVRAGWPGSSAQTLSPIPPIKTVGFALAYWEYDRLLDVYASAFGRANVCVLDYGRFAHDRSGVLDDLAAFLGIEPWVLTPAQLELRVNAGSPTAPPGAPTDEPLPSYRAQSVSADRPSRPPRRRGGSTGRVRSRRPSPVRPGLRRLGRGALRRDESSVGRRVGRAAHPHGRAGALMLTPLTGRDDAVPAT